MLHTTLKFTLVKFPDLEESSNVVLKMFQVIQSHVNHVLCFDNCFTLVNVLVELAKHGIFVGAKASSKSLTGMLPEN